MNRDYLLGVVVGAVLGVMALDWYLEERQCSERRMKLAAQDAAYELFEAHLKDAHAAADPAPATAST